MSTHRPHQGDTAVDAVDPEKGDSVRYRTIKVKIAPGLFGPVLCLTGIHCASGSTFELPIICDGVAVVKFAFQTKDHDIIFGVRGICEDGQELTILKDERIASHTSPLQGKINIPEQQTKILRVVFRWDNTYSWFAGKELLYSIEVITPRGKLLKSAAVQSRYGRLLRPRN